MKIAIKPQTIPLKNTEAVFIEMRAEFDLGAETSRIFWQVFDQNDQSLTYGTEEIPSEIHNEWHNDDNVIIDYVLSKLNLLKDE